MNAHNQNGKTEITDVQERSRIMILHATHQLDDVITPDLWPYTLNMVNKIRNIMPRMQDGLVHIALLVRTNQLQQIDHLHPFGFTVFILDLRIQ